MPDITTPFVDGTQQLRDVVMDLINHDEKKLAWQLIDHYYEKSQTWEHFDTLGYLSLKADKRDTYVSCAEAACVLSQTPEQLFVSRCNLIKAYNAVNRPEDALFYIAANLEIDPENFEMQCQRAFNISLMGDKDRAEQILTDLCEKDPSNAKKLESAFAGKHLREGRTAKGILSFVETFKPRNKFDTEFKMPRWTGTITPGKKLYVDIEGGIGDQIIDIRFFDVLRDYGMTPVLMSHDMDYYRDINQLFRRHGHEVHTDRVMMDRTQQWIPMMSIPGYLGLTEKDLWRGPYLRPLMQPHNVLTGHGPRIGIKCSGNPYFAQDEYRKIPLDSIVDILPQQATIYYIDKAPLCPGHPRVISLSDRISSWEDTLDFVAQMDCVVSSCTSLVHVAGAMGKACFVAVPIAEYYIWTTTRRDGSTPWYGKNFYVAKQTQLRDWTKPLTDIRHRLYDMLGLDLE